MYIYIYCTAVLYSHPIYIYIYIYIFPSACVGVYSTVLGGCFSIPIKKY